MVKDYPPGTKNKNEKKELREQLIKKLPNPDIAYWESYYERQLKDPNEKMNKTLEKRLLAKIEIIKKIKEIDNEEVKEPELKTKQEEKAEPVVEATETQIEKNEKENQIKKLEEERVEQEKLIIEDDKEIKELKEEKTRIDEANNSTAIVKTNDKEITKTIEENITQNFKKENEAKILSLEQDLKTSREKYAIGYKEFMAERKKNTVWYKNVWRKIKGDKVKEAEIPEELKNLENEYDKKAVILGKKMYEDKKQELLSSKIEGDGLIKELNKYKQTEIFNKIIIEEKQELNKLKTENLPPKEKALWRKTVDWYMRQNKATKIALSVALTSGAIALLLPSSIAAAGGAATYLTGRVARSTVGGTFGQLAVKGYDVSIKDRSGKRREEKETALKTNFNDADFADFSQSKKTYTEILEKEAIEKRNRILHKAMVAMVAGGAASIGTGVAMHNFLPGGNIPHEGAMANPEHPIKINPETHSGQNIETEHVVKTTIQTPEFKPESVAFSSKGAIATIDNLKAQIHTDYPDLSKAPHSIQEFMKTNSTQEAIKLGLYDPNNPGGAVSANLLKGSTLDFDKNGNLSYHDARTGQIHTLVHEQTNTETIEKYHGKMVGANHPAEHPTNENSSHNTGNSQPENANNIKHEGDVVEKQTTVENTRPRYERPTAKTSPESIANTPTSKHFDFGNKDNTLTLKDNGSSLRMKFIYSKNGEILGTDVRGNYNSTDPYEYVNKKIDNLGSATRGDADKDIYMMVNEARFLKTLPHDTYEYKFLHDRVANMQKNIINDYGNILNADKLEGNFYDLKVGSEAANHLNPKMVALVNDTYESDIKHLFPDKKSISAWSVIKDSTGDYSAEKLINLDPTKVNESLTSSISFMQKIHAITGLDPKIATSIEVAESPTKYIRRGLMKAAELGKLKDLTLE